MLTTDFEPRYPGEFHTHRARYPRAQSALVRTIQPGAGGMGPSGRKTPEGRLIAHFGQLKRHGKGFQGVSTLSGKGCQ